MRRLLLMLLTLVGCGGEQRADSGSGEASIGVDTATEGLDTAFPFVSMPLRDDDGDGYLDDWDCDDDDPAVHSGALDVCGNGRDDDCDGLGGGDCTWDGQVEADEGDLIIRGDHVGASLGHNQRFVGDLDGDGRDDLVLGSPGLDDVGGLHVFTEARDGEVSAGESDHVWLGSEEGAAFGYSPMVACTEGNGIFVSAPSSALGSPGGGALYHLSNPTPRAGSRTHVIGADGVTVYGGEGEFLAVEAAGDMDGDGTCDAVDGGSTEVEGGYRVATVYASATEGLQASADALGGLVLAERTGGGAAFTPDVNGDGVRDLAVGLPGAGDDEGRTVIVHGPVDQWYSDADIDTTFEGFVDGWLGLTATGDVDGDGLEDVVNAAGGAPCPDGGLGCGAVYVHVSRAPASVRVEAAWLTFVGDEAERGLDNAGDVGDLDGDGHPELALGALGPESDASSGHVWVARGPHSAGSLVVTEIDFRVDGPEWSYLSTSLGRVGDVDGDGRDDLALGGNRTDDFTGSVWVFYSSRR